jgi:hypothetical protein
MPYDGSGNFPPLSPPVYPAVSGEIIYADHFNAVIGDILAGLSNAACKDGQSTLSGSLNLGGQRIVNAAAALVAGHFVEYAQWRASFVAPDFDTPTADTPADTDDSRRLATTEWARGLLAAAAALNLPSITGQQGALVTDGTVVEWRNAVPDFILMQQGIA